MFKRNVALQKQTTAILRALLSLRSIQHQADTLHKSLSHLTNLRSDERMGWISLKVTSPVVANSVFAKVTHWHYLHPEVLAEMFGAAGKEAKQLAEERIGPLLVNSPSYFDTGSVDDPPRATQRFLAHWRGHFDLLFDRKHQRVILDGPRTPLGMLNWTIHHGFAKMAGQGQEEERFGTLDKRKMERLEMDDLGEAPHINEAMKRKSALEEMQKILEDFKRLL